MLMDVMVLVPGALEPATIRVDAVDGDAAAHAALALCEAGTVVRSVVPTPLWPAHADGFRADAKAPAIEPARPVARRRRQPLASVEGADA